MGEFGRGRRGGGFGSRGGYGRREGGFGSRGGFGGERRESSFGEEKPVKEGEEYDVTISETGSRGDGIARIKNFVVFVPNTKKGDVVKIKITQLRGRSAVGEVVSSSGESSESAEATSAEATTEESVQSEEAEEEDSEEE